MTTPNLKPGTPFATAEATVLWMASGKPWYHLTESRTHVFFGCSVIIGTEIREGHYAPAIPADGDGLVHGTMTDPVTGESRPMTYQADEPEGEKRVPCPDCHGYGRKVSTESTGPYYIDCGTCHGTGKVPAVPPPGETPAYLVALWNRAGQPAGHPCPPGRERVQGARGEADVGRTDVVLLLQLRESVEGAVPLPLLLHLPGNRQRQKEFLPSLWRRTHHR